MASFNPMGVPTMADAIALNGMQHSGLGMDPFEQDINFDEAALL